MLTASLTLLQKQAETCLRQEQTILCFPPEAVSITCAMSSQSTVCLRLVFSDGNDDSDDDDVGGSVGDGGDDDDDETLVGISV